MLGLPALSAPTRPAGGSPRVAYIMSRFPKLTETFILFEMGAVENEGVQVELYPLRFERSATVHAEARRWVDRAHFGSPFSPAVLGANLATMVRQPARYFGALFELVRCNLGSVRYLAGAVMFFPRAVDFARRMKADGIQHVHAHFASHPAAVAWVIHRVAGIPYSFTAHGSDLHMDRHMLREKVRDAAFVVPISEFNRRVILDECGPDSAAKLEVIHCGVDIDAFTPGARATAANGTPTVLCVGTLHEVKGQTYLVDACRRLADRGLDVECHLVGDGPDQSMLESQAARLGITNRVVFRGRMTQDQVRGAMRAADIVATPSVPTRDGRREGIPVVLMEAMASARPVVASRLSGIPELVEHEVSGLLVEPRDAAGLAESIERLLRDPSLRDRLGQAARIKVEQQFDLQGTARHLARRFRAATGSVA
jgi:colanic acid/amylovoran biosynthesis glycosyltransferase